MQGYIPIHIATMYGHELIVKELLSRGADPKTQSEVGNETMTTRLCQFKDIHLHIVPTICFAQNGMTPLITAASEGYTGILMALVHSEHGVDIDKPDKVSIMFIVTRLHECLGMNPVLLCS